MGAKYNLDWDWSSFDYFPHAILKNEKVVRVIKKITSGHNRIELQLLIDSGWAVLYTKYLNGLITDEMLDKAYHACMCYAEFIFAGKNPDPASTNLPRWQFISEKKKCQ